MCTLTAMPPFAGELQPAKKPKAAPERWYPAAGKPSNTTEVLFLSFLACQAALDTHKVQELTAWATDVVRLAAPGDSLPDGPEWRMATSKPGSMIAPIYNAHKVVWSRETLETIAGAMQSWHGAGRYDGLNHEHLKRHLGANPGGPKVPGRKSPVGPPRIISAALVGVAQMVKDHGVALCKLLLSEEPRGPTMQEELLALQRQVAELEASKVEAERALALKADAHKHAAARLKAKAKAVSEARRDERIPKSRLGTL
jgi:hypothetical protein